MRLILVYLYMLFVHPFFFLKYTIRKRSTGFLLNGFHQNINSKFLYVDEKVRIGDYTRINFYSNEKLFIGKNCYIGQNNSFLVGGRITIENDVLMASNILITSENHSMDPISKSGYGKQKLICKPVLIENGCWIGEKVVILPGITIGEKSIIGAGSVVTKSIPPYCIAVGNPARIIKTYDFEKKEWISTDK